LPIRRYFGICVGMLNLSPQVFWQMSPIEVYMAVEAFIEFNGGEKEKPLTNTELEELMELYPD